MWGARQGATTYGKALADDWQQRVLLWDRQRFCWRKQELALNFENWEFLNVEEFLAVFNKEIGQGHIKLWNTEKRSRGLYQCGPL